MASELDPAAATTAPGSPTAAPTIARAPGRVGQPRPPPRATPPRPPRVAPPPPGTIGPSLLKRAKVPSDLEPVIAQPRAAPMFAPAPQRAPAHATPPGIAPAARRPLQRPTAPVFPSAPPSVPAARVAPTKPPPAPPATPAARSAPAQPSFEAFAARASYSMAMSDADAAREAQAPAGYLWPEWERWPAGAVECPACGKACRPLTLVGQIILLDPDSRKGGGRYLSIAKDHALVCAKKE